MANVNSSAPRFRPSKDATLQTLERLAAAANTTSHSSAPSVAGGAPRRLASGIYRFVDEYAGLERLDRIELDETDEDDAG